MKKQQNEETSRLINSIIVKILIVGALILILLIPGEMIKSLITDRETRRDEAIDEVRSKWGNTQTITGPIMIIPYYRYGNTDNETNRYKDFLYILPEFLNVNAEISPEIRNRGIFDVILYDSQITIKGNFKLPEFSTLHIEKNEILGDEISFLIGISDMRGINNEMAVTWNNKEFQILPGLPDMKMIESGVNTNIPLDWTNGSDIHHFSFNLSLNGSEALYFVPVGKSTQVNISSNWLIPGFDGAFLPGTREITDDGFNARWNVLNLNRNFPQYWKGQTYDLEQSKFGVRLLFPVNQYQKTTRSVKYSIMFTSLTFLIFLFVEILNKKRIHPIQYLFVGLGLTIFYILLLSLSEQARFNFSYVIASLAIIGLITAYSKAVFKSWKQTRIITLCLVILYGFLFTVLQLQDFALLFGSIGLFIALAVVMYISRNVNWYALDRKD
jgi:inner membrane protein